MLLKSKKKALMLAVCAAALSGPAAGGDEGGGGTPFSITYIGASSLTFSPFTFTGQDIGAADASRIVVISIAMSGAATVTGVTCGGVAATQASGAAHSTGSNSTDIWYLSIPTGTTSDITVSTEGTFGRLTIFVHSVIGSTFGSGGGATITNSSNAVGSGSLTVPLGGGTIGVAYEFASGSAATSDMSTTDVSSGTLGGAHWIYAGHDTDHTGSQSFTVTFAGASSILTASFATFGP